MKYKNSDLNNAYVLAIGYNVAFLLLYVVLNSLFVDTLFRGVANVILIIFWFYSIRQLWMCKCK